jgi:uncharacterized membrane protein (UPF0136 family)
VFNGFGGHMGYKFWIVRALKVFGVVLVLLFVVQLLKQHSIEDSVLFAVTWSFLTTLVFIGSRLYQSRKGIECAICNDITDPDNKTPSKQSKENT